MKLILHIGMGKTGSSAIQAALAESAEPLRAQRAEYLGMWFDMVDVRFRGLHNQEAFFAQPPEEMAATADVLLRFFRARAEEHGIETFVLSNEAMSGRSYALKPLIDGLMAAGVAVRAIGYARDPAAWLPSAHVQWSIRDKVEQGQVQPYGRRARKLVNWYSGLLHWGKLLGDIVEVRPYDKVGDIVADFAQATGLDLPSTGKRVLERGEEAEILLRALFNNQFPGHVLPQVFDRAVLKTTSWVPSIDQMAWRCFDYSETDAIVAENAKLFDQLAQQFGFDLRSAGKTPPPRPDSAALRDRVVDCLASIVLMQGRRIERLEQRLAALERLTKEADDQD